MNLVSITIKFTDQGNIKIDMKSLNNKDLEKIRAIEETKDIPIIAITSYALVGDKEKILNTGRNIY